MFCTKYYLVQIVIDIDSYIQPDHLLYGSLKMGVPSM